MTLGASLGCGGCCLVPVTVRKLRSDTGHAEWKNYNLSNPRFILADGADNAWTAGTSFALGYTVLQQLDTVTDGVTRPPTINWQTAVETNSFAAFDQSGGIWLAGPAAPASGTQHNVWHYDSSGTLDFSDLWLTPLVSTADCISIGVLSGGDVIAWVQNSSFGNVRLQRRTPGGTLVWSQNVFPSIGSGFHQGVKIDPSDNILIAVDTGSGYKVQNRAASDGSLVWQTASHGSQILGLDVNPSGETIATNRNDASLGGGSLGYAARTYDASGNLLDSLAGVTTNSAAEACCWDDSDGTWVVGGTLTAATETLRKYSADLSTEIWAKVHLRPANVFAANGFVYCVNFNTGSQRD